jgi:PAS domain S-box-containing protein
LGSSVHLNIYDGDRVNPGQRIYQSQKEHVNDPQTTLFRESRIDFGGRQWLLVFDHHYHESVFTSYSQAWLVFVFGMTASIMLFLLLRSTMLTRENAISLAQELTKEIRQSKASLEESEFRWKFALEGSGLGVWDWNIQTGKVFYSTRWKVMLGYAEDEIGDGNDEWELRLHPDDRQAVHAHVQACQDGAEPYYDVDCRYLCRDGSYKWIRDRGMVTERSGDGEPLRMIGTHSDISERKLLEASLRQHQAELEAAQRVAQLGSWTLDLATGRVVWSESLYRMYSLDPDRPPPDYTAQAGLFTAESWDSLTAAVSRTQESGAFYELELEIIRVDGTHGWMLARGEAVRDMSGAIVGLRGIVMDISERKQTQTRVEHLTNLYRALSACNSAIVHCTTQDELFANVCQIVVQHGGMTMAWIGLIDTAGSVAPAASYGMGAEYLDGIKMTVHADDPHGQGPTGAAVRENQPVWYDDFASNPGTAPWHERGARFGWAACAALPIIFMASYIKIKIPRLRFVFYAYYPLHLALLLLIQKLMPVTLYY